MNEVVVQIFRLVVDVIRTGSSVARANDRICTGKFLGGVTTTSIQRRPFSIGIGEISPFWYSDRVPAFLVQTKIQFLAVYGFHLRTVLLGCTSKRYTYDGIELFDTGMMMQNLSMLAGSIMNKTHEARSIKIDHFLGSSIVRLNLLNVVALSCIITPCLYGQEATSLYGQEATNVRSWKKHTVNDQSPFEAAGAADFDGDGDLDIFCGDSWYAAPDWIRHKVRDVPKGTNPQYHEDFADAPLDVNGDGRIDIVTCAYFSKKIAWLEQPQDPKTQWTENLIDTPGSMETGYLLDLFKDGTPVFLPNVGGQVSFYELTQKQPSVRWKPTLLAPTGAGHGIGHGDVNQDGRIDLITPKGWYEQPQRRDGDWVYHSEFSLGTASIEILGHDFDGDGDTDIVWGMGHDFGLHCLMQSKNEKGERVWTKEDIDNSFSQVHALHLADFDGDGLSEFATGKRIYAHASENGATAEPCIHIYKYDRNKSSWIKTVAYRGEPAPAAPLNPEQRDALKDFRRGSAGTGLQMVVADMDQDGDVDLVAPGKSGLYWLENLRLSKK